MIFGKNPNTFLIYCIFYLLQDGYRLVSRVSRFPYEASLRSARKLPCQSAASYDVGLHRQNQEKLGVLVHTPHLGAISTLKLSWKLWRCSWNLQAAAVPAWLPAWQVRITCPFWFVDRSGPGPSALMLWGFP